MARTPCIDKNGLRKGTWTTEEDWRLIAYVTRYGHWNWHQLPKFAGLARSGKSCRLRWMNYLRPNIKIGSYTPEEDETIIKLVQQLGYRWSAIASHMQGRTDNEIKNRWHTSLKKRVRENSRAHGKVEVSNSMNHSLVEPMPKNNTNDLSQIPLSPSQAIDSCSSTTLSPPTESLETTNRIASAGNTNLVSEDEFAFLNEPLREFSLLDDTPVDSIPNNTNDPFQFLLPASESTDYCIAPMPSSMSEIPITADHTPVVGYKDLVPEDEFGFLDALEEPMSGIFHLDNSTADPVANNMIDPFQILATSQSTYYCPASTPPSLSEFSITANYNHTITVSDKNLIPEDGFACLESFGEPLSGSFLLDQSLVDPMQKHIAGPFQNLPATCQTCPLQSSREIVYIPTR